MPSAFAVLTTDSDSARCHREDHIMNSAMFTDATAPTRLRSAYPRWSASPRSAPAWI